MNTEEKAKAYDEALEKARQLCAYPTTKPFISDLQDLFPELKESEGERIRKKIIATIHLYYGEPLEDEAKEMIFWLEKQGEQKMKSAEESLGIDSGTYNKIVDECIYCEQNLADKIEPKFKVGDWIVFNGFTLYIKEVVKGYYRTISKGGITNSYDLDIDNVARLWTIQDAKDGDVLEYQGEIFIIRELKKKIIASRTIEYYCCYDGEHFINNSIYSLMDDDLVNIHPSTQEQYNLLLKKMKEAGYTFDFDNKELKKVIDEKQIKKNLQDNSFRRMFEQNSSWSEEDEETLKDIITSMTNLKDSATSDALRDIYNSKIDWLESLRPNHWKPSDEYMKTNE